MLLPLPGGRPGGGELRATARSILSLPATFKSLLFGALLLSGTATFAHGDEDHSAATSTVPISTGTRAALQGDFAEAVLVPDAHGLTLWLDETDSNAPLNAALTLQIDGTDIALQTKATGLYRTELAAALAGGVHAVVLTVIAGEHADLLNGELTIATVATDSAHDLLSPWWALLLLPVLLLAFAFYGRRRAVATLAALAPLIALALLSTTVTSVYAHGGDDHEEEVATPASAQGDTPKRLADGTLFVPKSAQRLLNVRSEKVALGAHTMSLRLNGQVIADPNGSGLIQAPQNGRILPATKRLPMLGAKVRAGDTLALLEPVLNQSERASLTGELARVEASLAAAEKRLTRLNSIRDSMPRRELEQAEVELAGLRAQQHALADSLHAKLALKAPISGVVSEVKVIAGSQIEAGATVLEIVGSDSLVIEAAAYDDRTVRAVQRAVFVHNGKEYSLRLLGAGRKLRDQAIPVQFQIDVDAPAAARELAIGAIGTVLVERAEQQRGASVPQSALLRGDDGRPQVLVKIAPEQFKLITVSSETLPDNRTLIRDGLDEGDRVVTSGASLLQQIR